MQTRKKGFTLIEVMIAVVIIAILTTIGYPMYTSRLARGRQAAAKVALEGIRIAMENYRARNGGYLPVGGDFDALPGYEPSTWESMDSRARYDMEVVESTTTWYKIKAECAPPDCNIDDDDTEDIMYMDSKGKFTWDKNDLNE